MSIVEFLPVILGGLGLLAAFVVYRAVLRTIEGATHVGLIEYPEAIIAYIEDYLDERHLQGEPSRR